MLSQDKYFDLRSEVAGHFGLHPDEVLIVGSTKLGFRVAPSKQYRLFSDESDIDVVLVSSTLSSSSFSKLHALAWRCRKC